MPLCNQYCRRHPHLDNCSRNFFSSPSFVFCYEIRNTKLFNDDDNKDNNKAQKMAITKKKKAKTTLTKDEETKKTFCKK